MGPSGEKLDVELPLEEEEAFLFISIEGKANGGHL